MSFRTFIDACAEFAKPKGNTETARDLSKGLSKMEAELIAADFSSKELLSIRDNLQNALEGWRTDHEKETTLFALRVIRKTLETKKPS